MIEFGRTLRAAREAKGYTISQIAETTHLAPTTVEDLEREDFTRIPAPIYGRGFVKLYCEALGLDPKPMVAEFMEIFSGNHDTGIKERPVSQPSAEPPPAEPQPPTEVKPPTEPELPVLSEPQVTPAQVPAPAEDPGPEPASAIAPEPDLFAPPTPAPEPVTAPEPPPPSAPQPFDGLFSELDQPALEQPRLSRYAAPISQSQTSQQPSRFLSPALWRISALACAAIVIIWLAFLGIRALYRATSASPAEDSDTPPASALTAEEATAAKSAQPAAPRKPQAIPSLYID